MKRVTCLLGSGSTIDIEGPSTQELTRAVEECIMDMNDCYAHIINLINERCKNRYRESQQQLSQTLEKNFLIGSSNEDSFQLNFEDIFHCFECLLSIKSPNLYQINMGTLFLRQIDEIEGIGYGDIHNILREIIRCIMNRINSHCEYFQANRNQYEWFRNFWTGLSKKIKLDIVTLNYDNCLESFMSDWTDGFEERAEFTDNEGQYAYRFKPLTLESTDKSRIMHLHGCVNYERAVRSGNNIWKENIHDMYKYESFTRNDRCYSTESTQANEDIIRGPIITGHRKLEKIFIYPYEFYYYEFQKCLIDNSSLLIAGYSFGDQYINDMLIRMAEVHGLNRRIVLITYINKDNEPCVTGHQYQTIGRLLQCEYSDIVNRFYVDKCGYVDSKDGCMRVYFCGFKDTVVRYSHEIVNFLCRDSICV